MARRMALLLVPVALVTVLVTNWWVSSRTRSDVYTSLSALPANEVGIVLGCSPTLASGKANPFFHGRMDAAAELYQAGKVRHLLLSGDNSTRQYDEPAAMKAALELRGVPAEALTVDDAGFRTLDTMARASAVFGLRRATVITDEFHEPRALFLAQAFGLEAVGFPADRLALRSSARTRLREIAARLVACLDVYVLQTQPKFYGPRETIRVAQQ